MNILYLAFQVGTSKKMPRTGWVVNNVKSPESVAEHCFRVNILAMALAPMFHINQEKLLKMAIIHDLGETATGDLIVESGETVNFKKRKEKEKIEKEAIRNILFGYGEDYAKLFQEMIERKSDEAKIFWQLDKLEMAIQAYEYEKEQDLNLESFFVNAGKYIKHPILKEAFNDLLKMRKT